MKSLDFAEQVALAKYQLDALDVNRLQASRLRKDCRELELSYVYPGPLPYSNEINPDDIFSAENLAVIRSWPLGTKNRDVVSSFGNFEILTSVGMQGMPFKLYVHLPFCEQRCAYCFYETETGISSGLVDEYLKSLLAELDLVLEMIGSRPKTGLVYLGGGSPNYMSPEQTDFLLGGLDYRLERLPGSVLCIENHPHLVTEEHTEIYAKYGVNRISLGMQSFVDSVQSVIRRFQSVHRAVEGFRKVRDCQTVKEINLDVICGLPGQSIDQWLVTMERLLELRPEEITVYHSKLHPNSLLFHETLDIPSVEQVLLERIISMNILEEEGYTLTRPHHHHLGGRSDIGYQRAPGMELGGTGIGFQLGIGCSAYSHIGEFSFHNLQRREEYINSISKGTLPFLRGKRLNSYEKMILYVFDNLCNKMSLSMADYTWLFGDETENTRAIMNGLMDLELVEEKEGFVRLTNPAGILWYEEIGRQFYPDEMKRVFEKETRVVR